MHPKEIFWFSRSKYDLKVRGRETTHLQAQAECKRLRVLSHTEDLNFELILSILTHGAFFVVYLLSLRSIEVGDQKIAIIMAELRKRGANAKPAPATALSDEAVAKRILEALNDEQRAAVAKALEASGRQQLAATSDPVVGGQCRQHSISGEDERPPPYSATEEPATKTAH